MFEIHKTEHFLNCLERLPDPKARARIAVRLQRFSDGLTGDVRPVGEGISELRIDWGPGYRVYFISLGPTVLLIVAGGDKRSQEADIQRAKSLARAFRKGV